MIHGIGVDTVDISRVRGLLERNREGFLRRCFTEHEQAYALAHRDPAPSLAARFAAKEAALKALGVGWAPGVTWKDFEVVRHHGPPHLVLHGAAAAVAEELGGLDAALSLTHERGHATAFVILERR